MKLTLDKLARCSATIYRNGYYTGTGCSNLAKVEREGRAYCNLHDPEKVKARRDAFEQARRESGDAQAKERAAWNHENSQRRDAALGRLTALRKALGLPLLPEAPQSMIPREVDGMKLATESHPRFGISFTGGLVLSPKVVEFVTEHVEVLHGTIRSLAPR